MKNLASVFSTLFIFLSPYLFGQGVSMDWYLGDWTTSEQGAVVPKIQIKAESANTLTVRMYKDCKSENCFWEAASSTPVSSAGAELDPVKNADLLNGAFIHDNEKVFFDLLAMEENIILAEINILTEEGPQSLMLEFERQNRQPTTLVEDTKGSIYGSLVSEQSKAPDYTLVIFNPETGKNHFIKPDATTGKFRLQGLDNGSYYFSVNLPEGSKEKSRFEYDNPNNPLIIVNKESVEINIKVKPINIFEDKTELTSN